MQTENKKFKVAHIFGDFPYIATFLVNQIADLKDRGIDLEIFTFGKNECEGTPERYFEYSMNKYTHNLDMPQNFLVRLAFAFKKAIHVLLVQPKLFLKIFDWRKYGKNALSLKLLFWVEPFLGKEFDLVHCHFGPIANKFLIIKDILGLKQKFMTTFYGLDVSQIFQQRGEKYYDRLKEECSLFLVMSNNMKERVINHGFSPEKIIVHCVSIEVGIYPFKLRTINEGEPINIISVGRFVEKKGFDDLLRALAIVREKTKKAFKCFIIGDGPLRDKIYELAKELKLNDTIEFKGYMKIEEIIKFLMNMHFFVQPSKTAEDGDME